VTSKMMVVKSGLRMTGTLKECQVGCILLVKTDTRQKDQRLIFLWIFFSVPESVSELQ
jgi:hypothetical protein